MNTCRLLITAAFMGPWFAWWYPFLAAKYASIYTRLGLELFTGMGFCHGIVLTCIPHTEATLSSISTHRFLDVLLRAALFNLAELE